LALADALPDGYRLTVRRHAALSAVAELCAEGSEPCSREVRERAGIPYEGQASHLLANLERGGLVENARAGAVGTRKAWRVTPQGQAVLDANPPLERAVAREFERPKPQTALRAVPRTSAPSGQPLGSTAPADFRLTIRTQMALAAVAKANARGANPSNLEVSQRIGISGQGTVSRMMARLQGQGLIENTRGRDTKGVAKAWRLTSRGQAVLDAHRPTRAGSGKDPATVRGGKLVPKRGRPAVASSGRGGAPVAVLTRTATDFRLTVRTHRVLTAIAEHAGPSSREIAEQAGVRDEGQLSKLLARLADRGLIHNSARASAGFPKAWRLTPQGEALLHANTPAHEMQAA
jgi:DNA-binding MarR family transcriptional regulator